MQYEKYDYDLLLEYLSRKESESYVNFKKYVLNLNYDLTQGTLRQNLIETGNFNFNIDTKFRAEQLSFVRQTRKMLSRLAHCEFYFKNNESRFTIAPPVICMQNKTYKGILCGKRTSDMTEELITICEKAHCTYTEYENISAPKTIFVDFENQENLENFQKLLCNTKYISDLKIQKNFSEIIFTHIPNVGNLAGEVMRGNLQECDNFDENITGNKQIFNINLSKCETEGFVDLCKSHDISDWSIIKDNKNGYNQSYYLKYNQKYYHIDKHYGVLLNLYNLNKTPFLSWENNKLTKKKYWLQFPELIERVLTLRSGYNIDTNNKEIIYKNIDRNTAELLTQVSGLEVEYE